jgi:hypothetical protein
LASLESEQAGSDDLKSLFLRNAVTEAARRQRSMPTAARKASGNKCISLLFAAVPAHSGESTNELNPDDKLTGADRGPLAIACWPE